MKTRIAALFAGFALAALTGQDAQAQQPDHQRQTAPPGAEAGQHRAPGPSQAGHQGQRSPAGQPHSSQRGPRPGGAAPSPGRPPGVDHRDRGDRGPQPPTRILPQQRDFPSRQGGVHPSPPPALGGQRDHPQWRPDRFPHDFRSPHRFRTTPYVPPLGFAFRMWGYGEILPHAWWSPQYRILNWWNYDLPMPPPGYVWVRVGADALLIDPVGRVVQVVDNVFW